MIDYKLENTIVEKYFTAWPNSKFEQLSPEVWIWRGFLTKEECKEILDKAFSQEPWEYYDKTQVDILPSLSERLREGIDGEYKIKDFAYVRRFLTEQGMVPHCDIYGWNNRMLQGLVDKDAEVDKVKVSSCNYATLLYYNDDYEGGEIVYPEWGIEYKPVAGDLVIHSAEVVHGVKLVKSGIRYASQSVTEQDCYLDANFYENFKWPKPASDEEEIQVNGMSDDPDFQFDAAAEIILNERLRNWADNNPDISPYAHPCTTAGCRCRNHVEKYNIVVD